MQGFPFSLAETILCLAVGGGASSWLLATAKTFAKLRRHESFFFTMEMMVDERVFLTDKDRVPDIWASVDFGGRNYLL